MYISTYCYTSGWKMVILKCTLSKIIRWEGVGNEPRLILYPPGPGCLQRGWRPWLGALGQGVIDDGVFIEIEETGGERWKRRKCFQKEIHHKSSLFKWVSIEEQIFSNVSMSYVCVCRWLWVCNGIWKIENEQHTIAHTYTHLWRLTQTHTHSTEKRRKVLHYSL